MAGLSWWVYMMIFFIFLSGYMAFRAIRAEKQLEHQYIEHEGKRYIERIEAERKHKQGERERM